ncbi:MAG: hypothetical protein GY820_34210, partial [Gammaproteobacteria bacterium]|nr:hypothetical protein [Gammaproteobacteria bacterium]
MFTPIDAFLHETRELVQCALPGLTQQWPDRIRSCLMQALPPIWDQILSCSDKSYQQMVEWIRAQSVKIQNDPQEEWEDWVKIAYEQNQQAEASSNFCGILQQQQQPQQYNRLQEPPPYTQSQNWHPPNQSYENKHSTFGNPSVPTVRNSGGPNFDGPSYHHTGNNQGENIRSMGKFYAGKTPFVATAS